MIIIRAHKVTVLPRKKSLQHKMKHLVLKVLPNSFCQSRQNLDFAQVFAQTEHTRSVPMLPSRNSLCFSSKTNLTRAGTRQHQPCRLSCQTLDLIKGHQPAGTGKHANGLLAGSTLPVASKLALAALAKPSAAMARAHPLAGTKGIPS